MQINSINRKQKESEKKGNSVIVQQILNTEVDSYLWQLHGKNGTFSYEKWLGGLQKDTPVSGVAEFERLGRQGTLCKYQQ